MAGRVERIGDCTLYLGRAEDVRAAGLIPADAAIVSDVPYGMNYNTDSTRFTGGKGCHNKRSPRIAGDDKDFDPTPWLGFGVVALWGSNHFASRLPVGATLVWIKKGDAKLGKFLSDAELCWINRGHGVYVMHHVWDGCARESENGEHHHPAQKPVALMEWTMRKAGVPSGGLVCDPYMGSCSTGVACVRTGRAFIGVESEPQHFETAVRRIRAAVESPLFDAPPAETQAGLWDHEPATEAAP